MIRRNSMPLLVVALGGLILAACGGTPPVTATPARKPAGDPARGMQIYATTCVACHGPQAEGVNGLGKNLTASDFVRTRSDAELVRFLATGRPAGDPLNTTSIDMPPKGGNPSLKDEDLQHLVALLRSLQK